MIAKNG